MESTHHASMLKLLSAVSKRRCGSKQSYRPDIQDDADRP